MADGLRQLPRSEFGAGWLGVQPADLASGFVLPAANLAAGSVTPSKIGLSVHNSTGGTLSAGTLVYINGRDATSGFSTVAKASASGEATLASWIVIADIANGANGTVAKNYTLTGQNTNAATVGDYVYLDTTAGGYTLTTAPALGLLYQRIGTVSVKSATVGQIVFNLLDWIVPQILQRPGIALRQIATTGVTESDPIVVERSGTILGFRVVFLTALAVDATNYLTLSVQNRTTSKLLTAAVAGNSTQTGAGSQAIVQYGAYVLTVTATAADLAVSALDVVTLVATVQGTLGAALNGTFTLVMAPN